MTARVRSIGPEVDLIFGQNMARLRDELGWSPQELSKQIWLRAGEDLSVATILAMEDPKRERRISIGEAKAIAKTFGVTVDSLCREITN
jgi:hypothetical protein